MTAPTLTLAEFLLARIAEDEAAARESGADAMVGWRWKHYPREAYEELQALTLTRSKRVLAECDAKRRIVELHEVFEGDPYGEIRDRVVYWCPQCDHDRDYGGIPHDEEGCATIRALALPYADHPDYREEWKP